MNYLEQLKDLRQLGGLRDTLGLTDETILRFSQDAQLGQAILWANEALKAIRADFPEYLDMDETAQAQAVQAGIVNFYPEDGVNPYIAIAACGPWVITSKGAVVHDSGGYGMLGFGHTPKAILDVLHRPVPMANVMTPSFHHLRFTRALRKEVGQRRGGQCPYAKFLCLNSGSETVSLAGRIADVNTKLLTDPGAPRAGWKVKRIAIQHGFHGRTELPAFYSDSSRSIYERHLASFRDDTRGLITIAPYDVAALKQVFADAARERWHIEAMFLEPVMGEGNPGQAVTPEFYQVARELTKAHGTLLLVDSIQAGLRAHGVLSIVDYPGFENLEAPDMETYSKALNAGQFPLSVLAVNERAAGFYRKGIYGNTMTSTARAMDVAITVLEKLTPDIRKNIVARGKELVEKLEKLAKESPGLITKVQGTGLLVSCELSAQFKCYGAHSIESFLRQRGIGVIHGGTNSLRFTPHFAITGEEIELLVAGIRHALLHGPRQGAAEQKNNQAAA